MLDRLWESLKKLFQSRTVPIVIVYVILFCILIIRMFSLQIVESNEFVEKQEKTEEKQRDIKSTRGKIYDCNGVLLATNELSYSITIEDTGEVKTNEEKNAMIYNMLQILKDHDEKLALDFYIKLNKKGVFEYTVDKKGELRFKRDAYFAKSVDELTDAQKSATAYEVFQYLRKDVSANGPKFDIDETYSRRDALDIMSVRYNMMINNYTKYIPIVVASDVKEDTVIAIKESSAEMPGVKVEESTKRVYYDSKYFSNIIGYTGRVSSEDLEELKEQYPKSDYYANDQIGKAGIELSMEKTLRGKSGQETIVIDKNSRIIDTKDRVEPTVGNDVYLSIDSDLQKACYTILEKMLAGILISKINNSMDAGTKGESASDIRIPIYDVYNAIIENNVVNTEKFSAKKASKVEKKIFKKFDSRREKVLAHLDSYIKIKFKKTNSDLGDEYYDYMNYIYDMLIEDNMIMSEKIDKTDSTYTAYEKGDISLSRFLEEAIVKNWVNFDALNIGDKFYTTAELFDRLKEYIFTRLDDNLKFNKIIYKYLIYNYSISGADVSLALIEQNVVKATDSQKAKLKSGEVTPYAFILSKITNLELTPAMLALDPCSGSIIITDVNTGKVKAYVSYPTYDNNRFANNIDTDYYNDIMSSLAFPLMNRPSMQKTAPGSTFKMVTAAAAEEEEYILKAPGEKIMDKHEFKEVNPAPKCWSSVSHGKINVVQALRDSCNYFFYEMGYRMGLSDDEVLNHEKGLNTLKKYAEMFGLGNTSGIELPEAEPKISDYDCVRSAIGQGKNSYTPSQLSRYVTSIANNGKCYDLSIISKVVNAQTGKEKFKKTKLFNDIQLSDLTWNYIHMGMRKVITDGSVSGLFKDSNTNIAGKTGTAQENDSKPNHALFVSYAPYESPEISVTTVIPNGYTSGNAAELARDIYRYIYNEDERNTILDRKVTRPENQSNAFSD